VSLQRLLEHRDLWARKPVLAAVYGVWFDALLGELPPRARVLEVGAGPGFFTERVRQARPDLRWVSSDLLPAPWNHVAADALRLPFRDAVFDAVVGLDFVHHLARPADFFREAARVLKPGGRVASVEPWITPLSYPVYRFIHHELCRMDVDPWDPFAQAKVKDAFDGDSALVHALAGRTSAQQWRDLGLRAPRVRAMNGFAYLLSLGFKSGSLLPPWGTRPMLGLDAAASGLARWLGLRALLVWERLDVSGG
jgi:SAM-dependent methyltransferase